MSKPQVTFNEDENAEIEYEETAIEDDPEVYHQFLTLVDGVIGSLALLQADMDNYLYFKDELMQQMLPPNLLLQFSLISGKLFRSYSDLQFPLWELLRLVRVYSSPWEEKKAALQKMHEDYARKKSQLDIALKRLSVQDADVKRAARERRVMNWEKLFGRVQMARGHGRRWKFRMYDFKKRAAMGVEYLGRYFAEDQSDLESVPDEARPAEAHGSDDDNAGGLGDVDAEADTEAAQVAALEEKAAAAALEVAEEFPEIELESLGEESTEEPPPRQQTDVTSISLPANIAPVETSDAEVWTDEPEFARTLHLRVYPAKQVKAKQVTVDVAFNDASLPSATSGTIRLEAQDVGSRAADDKRRMQRRRQPPGESAPDTAASYQEACFAVPNGAPLPGRQAPSLRLSVLNERMDPVGAVVLTLKQLEEAQLITFDVTPPPLAGGGEEVGDVHVEDREQRRRALDELGPVDYPVMLNDADTGAQLPLLAYWTRSPLYRTADRDNNTASVYQLVQELTGIDLTRVTREELTREKVDACMSPRPLTPQPENVPKEAVDKLNEEFAERLAQLEQEYVNKLKELEAQLGAARQGGGQSEASVPPPPPPLRAETQERATSAPRSLPSSRASTAAPAAAAATSDDATAAPPPAANAKKVVGIRLPPRPTRPKKNFMIGRPLPAWGESFPEDFFERMELLGHLTKEHKAQLVARIRAEIAREVEAQLVELSRLAATAVESATNAAEGEVTEGDNSGGEVDVGAVTGEVTIPALFMPQRGEPKVYNPRAHLYFQPHGLRGARLTQPPSMLSLPPLPNRPSILNLFDLSTRASHPTAATISVGVPPNSAIQTQLNLLKKAVN